MFHRHTWKVKEEGYGVGPKNNAPDKLAFRGHLEMCDCGLAQFRPDDRRLRVVPVETERRKS